MRNPTPEELRVIKNLVAEAQYLEAVASARFTRLLKVYDVAAADGVDSQLHFVHQGKTLDATLTPGELDDWLTMRRDAQAAGLEANVAGGALKKACGAEMSLQWDPKAGIWRDPEQVPVQDEFTPPAPGVEEAPAEVTP